MKGKKCTFEKLTAAAAGVLKNKRKRTAGTIRHYYVLWKKVKRFMDVERIRFFDSAVGKAYLLKEFGNQDYAKLSKREKDLIRAVGVLSEFQESGTIQFVKEQCVFDGSVGKQMTSYISHKIAERLNSHTIAEHEQHLFRFLCFLNKIGITSIEAINHGHVLNFLRGMNSRFSTLTHLTLGTLRGFFSHLYDEHFITVDIAAQIPRDNYKRQAKLPSTYSVEEIEKMIATIDRGNATGKRNYAIVLLAARLGLRASDIANLKFENLLWEKCSIVLHQYKTGRKLELPILSDVGDAIIDYLKYGRPKSNEAFVFLLVRAPYTRIHGAAITGIVKSSLVEAGIPIKIESTAPTLSAIALQGFFLRRVQFCLSFRKYSGMKILNPRSSTFGLTSNQ